MDPTAPADSERLNRAPLSIEDVPPPVPAETLPVDPDGGGYVVDPPAAADYDLMHVPPDVLYQLQEVTNALAVAVGYVGVGVGEGVDAVARLVDTALSECHAVTDAVAGGVLASTDGVAVAAARAADRLVTETGRRIGAESDGLRSAGVDVPYDPGVWAMMLDTAPPEWLPHIVPQIGQKMGDYWHPDTVDCTKFPSDPACDGPTSPPAPPPPPVDWTQLPVKCPDGSILPPGSDPALCTVPTPPFPPPPPPPPLDPPVCPPWTPPACPVPLPVCPPPSPPVVVVQVAPQTTCPVPPPPPPPTTTTNTCPDVSLTVSPVIMPGPVDLANQVPFPDAGASTDADNYKDPLNWSTLTPCVLDVTLPTPPPPIDQVPTGAADAVGLWFRRTFEGTWHSMTAWASMPARNETEGLSRLTSAVLAMPSGLLNQAMSVAYDLFDWVAPGSVGNVEAAKYFGTKVAAAAFAQDKSGFPMPYLFQSQMYAFQYANPQYLPSQTQIDSLFTFGRIDDDVWDCWTRAQGNIPRWARMYRDLQAGRPTLDQLIQLKLRGELSDQEFIDKSKKIGYPFTENVRDIEKLSIQIPTQSDLLRMMVRDSFDEKVVKDYQYDFQFDDKFKGKAEQWAKAQGIPKEIFQFYWRAHWDIPSNTQLYEMFHRLRPDRHEVLAWDAYAINNGEPAAVQDLGPRPQVVTIKDVETALQVNDQAPTWIPRQLDISYHPITRTDATRAYQIGSFDEHQLHSAMMDNGYNKTNASLLVKYYKSQKVRSNANATGVLTIRKTVKLYKQGALSRAEAMTALEPLMPAAQDRDDLLDRSDLELRAEMKLATLKGYKRRFVLGEPSEGGWLNTITDVVGDAASAQRVLDQWSADYFARLREPTALMLCRWYGAGVISPDDYLSRLERLGYTHNDALTMASVCHANKVEALRKEAERRRKAAEAESLKRQKYRDKLVELACHPKKPCWDGTPAPIPSS